MVETWIAPALDTLYVCYDENGTPLRMCRYVDFLSDMDAELWPKCVDDYELLLWSYNAEPVSG